MAPNVVFLGLTSLFTDISSEMVNAVLPLYLTFQLRWTPLQFGLFDGVYQGMVGLLRLAGGAVADRWRRYKEVAAVGYGVSALCKLGLLAAGNAWLAATAILFIDRTGKGIRTAPRDALISLSARDDELGWSFGVHRALDTTGAMLGPLLAFVLLARVPQGFDAIFVVSFCAAVLGLGVLFLFVQNERPPKAVATRSRSATAPAAGTLRATFRLVLDRRYRALLIAGSVLALATVSDGFVYLILQRRLDLRLGYFPLLYVATASVYLVLAAPVGRMADRIGRGRVLIGGYVLLLGVYVGLGLSGPGTALLFATPMLFGAYYAATDGVLMALASSILPSELRAGGLALLTTAVAVCRLVASFAFGALWTWKGPSAAVASFSVGLLVALGVAAIVLLGSRWQGRREDAVA